MNDKRDFYLYDFSVEPLHLRIKTLKPLLRQIFFSLYLDPLTLSKSNFQLFFKIQEHTVTPFQTVFTVVF